MFIKSLPTLLSSVLVLPCAYALQENSASIGINATVTSAHITISGGSGNACAPGQYWHIPDGKCRTAAFLRNVSAGTEAGVSSCDPGYTGSTYLRRDCSKPLYGWTTPNGEIFSYYGAKSCGAWYVTSSNCTAVPPPSSPPPSGPVPGSTTTMITANLICDATNPNYSAGNGTISDKNKIIKAYLNHPNKFGRCPEMYYTYNGWTFWQSKLSSETIDQVVTDITNYSLPNSEVQKVVDHACVDSANKAYGAAYVSAVFIKGSGNKCTVTF